MRIATRLTLLLLLAVAMVLAGFGYIRAQQERQRLIAELEQEVGVLGNSIKLAIEHALRSRQPQDVQDLLAEIVRDPNPVDRIRIFDRRLQEIASASNALTARIEIPQAELTQAARTGETRIRFVETSGRPMIYAVLPLKDRRGGISGVLEVTHVAARVERQIQQAIQDQALGLSLLSVTIAVVIWLTVRVSIRRPIGRLVRTVLAFGQGDLSRRIELRRRDEIGQLATAFNRMAEELQKAQAELIAHGQARLELERQLQQGQKLAAVGRLASEVAHEVGTPLNIISGRAETIRNALPPDHPLEQHVATVLRQTERITGILRQLLDYTRPRRPAARPLPVGPALTRLVELLEPLAQRREVALTAQVAADLPSVLADPDLCQHVLLNLVTNALDATPPGGQIHLSAADGPPGPSADAPDVRPRIRRGAIPEPCVTIVVADTGGGIPAQRLEKIFEPFFSTKETGRGTGLGLAIVEDIVRAHRGAIEIASAEGRGTSVLLYWPAAREPGEPGGIAEGVTPNDTRHAPIAATDARGTHA